VASDLVPLDATTHPGSAGCGMRPWRRRRSGPRSVWTDDCHSAYSHAPYGTKHPSSWAGPQASGWCPGDLGTDLAGLSLGRSPNDLGSRLIGPVSQQRLRRLPNDRARIGGGRKASPVPRPYRVSLLFGFSWSFGRRSLPHPAGRSQQAHSDAKPGSRRPGCTPPGRLRTRLTILSGWGARYWPTTQSLTRATQRNPARQTPSATQL